MTIRKILLCGAMLLPFERVSAVCLDNRHPNIRDEFRFSVAVVVGRVSGHKDIMEDSDDPTGITATIYQIVVQRRLKGVVGQTIQLRSENTSSRFPMEEGEGYLLFLNKNGNNYFVDNCGNSVRAGQAKKVLSEIGVLNDVLR